MSPSHSPPVLGGVPERGRGLKLLYQIKIKKKGRGSFYRAPFQLLISHSISSKEKLIRSIQMLINKALFDR